MSLGMTPAEKAGLIEYNGEKSEMDRWKFLIKRASECINSSLTLISTVLWYGAKCYLSTK